jgi:uncharacterized protein
MTQESRYNFWSRTPEGHELLFNGRTGALIELPPSDAALVREALAGETNPLTAHLEAQGFLWADDPDREVETVIARRSAPGSTTRELHLTISPTYGCNFRCTYCYVHFDDTRMDPDAERRTLAFVDGKLLQHRDAFITWFGGEPLLQWRRVAAMASEITRLGASHGSRVEQLLTTNGYLLTRPVAATLVEAGIHWFHVTIDGCGEGQDHRRVLQNAGPTYHRVLGNFIDLLQDHPEVGGTLRMNLEEESVDLAGPLLATIPEDLRNRVQVHPTPVIREGTTHDAAFLTSVARVVTQALKLGYAYYDNDLPVGRAFHCTAEGERNFQIGPDAVLHKCSPSGKPEVTVGCIDESGSPALNPRAEIWTAAHPVVARCRECEYLCSCQGGCRLDRVRERWDPSCRDAYLPMPVHVLNLWLSKKSRSRVVSVASESAHWDVL